MERIGLTDREFDLICSVFDMHPAVTGVICFGERVGDTFDSHSDIEFAVRGISNPLKFQALVADLEELPLPYRFNIQALELMTDEPLREHIDRVGVVVYSRL